MEKNCKCGLPKNNHPKCQACTCWAGPGHEQNLILYREKKLCEICVQLWQKLDRVLGHQSDWKEFLSPPQALNKPGRKEVLGQKFQEQAEASRVLLTRSLVFKILQEHSDGRYFLDEIALWIREKYPELRPAHAMLGRFLNEMGFAKVPLKYIEFHQTAKRRLYHCRVHHNLWIDC